MKQEFFPDNTLIADWFYDIPKIKLEDFGKQYLITNYGIVDDGNIYTEKFQSLIDTVSEDGGGVIVVPAGIYYSGALFLKNGVNLYIERNGVLKGSDDIADYPLCTTRIEGETCKYFPALINADDLDGIKICGEGTIDGNGLKSWKAFWIRREWNPDCTNKDEQRPRLMYFSNCRNVLVSGLKLQNSHFWTNHFYNCQYVKVIDCSIFSPFEPIPAPSTDAIDIDVCTDVLIKGCYFHVNDDAVALKGGKGPNADLLSENGSNERIVIEDCEYGYCHSCLTCGSESIHNRNVVLRNINISKSDRLLWLKMRPDTPQHYEYISIDNANGYVDDFISVFPWKQFFDLKGKKEIIKSFANNVTISNCNIECKTFFAVKCETSQYELSNFLFNNLNIIADKTTYSNDAIKNLSLKNVSLKQRIN